MYNLGSGTHIPKYNPIYVVSDRPNISLSKPVSVPVIRWELYAIEFKNISPHTRWRRYDCCTTESSWRHDHAVAMISCVVIMFCYANFCYDVCNIVVWWIWPTRCRPTETKPDETRYYQMQSGRICPMVSLSAHRGLMPVSPFPVNIMNDMMFTMFIVVLWDVWNVWNFEMFEMFIVVLWNSKRAQTNPTRFVTSFASSLVTSNICTRKSCW